MRKLFILTLAVVLVFGMSAVGMAQDNDADVDQVGTSNIATIEQDSENKSDYDEGNHFARIYQNGNNNVAGQKALGANSILNINQEGSSNEAYQTQTLPGVGSGSEGDIDQVGSNNLAVQSFGQQGQFARIYQEGNNNTAVQNMDDGVVNEQYATQVGSWNESYQNAEGKYNVSTVNQDGTSNFASTDQTSENNVADINQVGSGNAGVIIQRSNDNDADLTQTGNNNESTIIQN